MYCFYSLVTQISHYCELRREKKELDSGMNLSRLKYDSVAKCLKWNLIFQFSQRILDCYWQQEKKTVILMKKRYSNNRKKHSWKNMLLKRVVVFFVRFRRFHFFCVCWPPFTIHGFVAVCQIRWPLNCCITKVRNKGKKRYTNELSTRQ